MRFRYDCDGDKAAELAARAALLVAGGAHLADFADCSLRDDARVALEEAWLALRSAARAARGHAVADGIAVAAAEWCRRLRELRDRPGREACGRAVLERLLHACDANALEDPLEAMARYVDACCVASYGHDWPEVEVAIATRGEHPRGEADPYGITGLALPAADGMQVRLQIHVESFGAAALAAVPVVLAHECVCHVATRPRGQADNESFFAEGFMDWAASYYLRAWDDRLPGALPAMSRTHAERLLSVLTRAPSPAATARIAGRRRAEGLVHALRSHHGMEEGDAGAQVARLAVGLNVADVRAGRREAWAGAWFTEGGRPLSQLELDCLAGRRPPEDIL